MKKNFKNFLKIKKFPGQKKKPRYLTKTPKNPAF